MNGAVPQWRQLLNAWNLMAHAIRPILNAAAKQEAKRAALIRRNAAWLKRGKRKR